MTLNIYDIYIVNSISVSSAPLHLFQDLWIKIFASVENMFLSFPDNAVLTLCYTLEVISRGCMYMFYVYTILCKGHQHPQILVSTWETNTQIQYTDRFKAHCSVVWVIIKSIPLLHREMSYVYILGVDCVSKTFVTRTKEILWEVI